MGHNSKIYAVVDHEDPYVQPLLLSTLKAHFSQDQFLLIQDVSELPAGSDKLLQWRQYESIDFDHVMSKGANSVANSYVIRKALIRKHYLSTTVSHWLVKHPDSVLKHHVKPSVEFEVDYAEFLDDALLEAYELKESWARNEELPAEQREWWILKPGMSDRGQGIRLFSTEEELTDIFEEWDPPSDDEDEETSSQSSRHGTDDSSGVMASQLRHFIAQPYVHPPLLMPAGHPSERRKFHIRTYVLATGALQVYVYKQMLALFAGQPYSSPGESTDANENLSSHLTNTCLQSGEREGSVHAFWSLPSQVSEGSSPDWKEHVFKQICDVTGEVFEAAARTMGIHFQPLPNAFEIYGLDFMVDADGTAWLLEVNAFPDFAQTGKELQILIQGLFEEVVEVAVKPMLASEGTHDGSSDMIKVLDIDLGRR